MLVQQVQVKQNYVDSWQINVDVKLRKYDMSEYMEQHPSSKLIGAPGYVGHAEGGVGSGQLINDVEEQSKPYCSIR